MGWFSTFFNFDNGRRAGSQVFSSTHDAFSLPTSSPSMPLPHPDAFNPPTPEPATPTAFTYPPQGGYLIPSSRPGFTSLLPTHQDPIQTRSPYPPLSKTWARIHNWLNKEYPELGDTLNYGILPQDLSEIEMELDLALPAVIRESYLCVDGQEAESSAGCSEGLFFGLKLLPLESVLEEWKFWREVDHDPMTGANAALVDSMQSIPPNWVRKAYSQRGWIPLIADKVGNYVGVDLTPGELGQVGQVVVFGRDFDTKVVLWRGDGPTGWAKWLSNFADELEAGDGFEIGNNDDSEGSEDDLGYEGYFYDGKEGVGDVGSGGGLKLSGEYKGWNVLEAWADRSLRKWHQAGVITDADLVTLGESPTKPSPGDLDIVDSKGSATEIHIPILNHTEEHIPPPSGLRSHNSQRSQSTIRPTGEPKRRDPVPAIAITKPPTPLPVSLPTPHDIAPLASPPESDDDLEAGRGHDAELSLTQDDTENVGLVNSTRRKGRSKSPMRRQGTDSTTDSVLPLPPTPRSYSDLVTRKSASSSNLHSKILQSSVGPISASASALQVVSTTDVPDLLMDTTPSTLYSAPPLEPSSSSHAKEADDWNLEIPTASNLNQEEAHAPDSEPDTTTIRLIGGGGETGISRSPVEVVAEEMKENHSDASHNHGTAHDTQTDTLTQAAAPKEHKKSKTASLASLKRFSVGAFGRKKDPDLSTRDASSR